MQLCACIAFVLIASSFGVQAQTLPAKIQAYLDKTYMAEPSRTGDPKVPWTRTPGECQNKLWLISADFDANGKLDYVVRITHGATRASAKQSVIAFIERNGDYRAQVLDERPAHSDGHPQQSGFALVKKGTRVGGESALCGNQPVTTFNNVGVVFFVCNTDDITHFLHRNGTFSKVATC